MTTKEAAKIVYQLHAAYPSDRKATEDDLLSRTEIFQITLAEIDFETVQLAVKHAINSNKFMPTVQEIYSSCKLLRTISKAGFITSDPEDYDDSQDEYLENFCKWIGLGYEEEALPKNFEI